jgi:hypothetical protein
LYTSDYENLLNPALSKASIVDITNGTDEDTESVDEEPKESAEAELG